MLIHQQIEIKTTNLLAVKLKLTTETVKHLDWSRLKYNANHNFKYEYLKIHQRIWFIDH